MNAPASASEIQTATSLLTNMFLNPILGALVRHRVPDHLDRGPLAATDLAQQAGMNALSLTRVLRALAASGAFSEVSPGVFANNAISDLFRDRTGSLRNIVLYLSSEHYVRAATALGHSAVTGQSAMQHVFGESFWEYAQRHPDECEAFNRGLVQLRGEEYRQIADAFDWAGVEVVVDVGGGAGSLLAAIMRAQPDIRGVLIEQPGVLPDAESALRARGVRDRCELKGGSFFDAIPAAGDVWTLCQVLHDWPDAECIAILRRCREAMRPTDRLLVIEMLTIPCHPNALISRIDIVMLMYFGEARQRTAEEYRSLLDASGFSLTRILHTAGAFSIVEAVPGGSRSVQA